MAKKMTFRQILFEQHALTILLVTFAATVVWIFSSIYFSYSTTTLSTEAQQDILPLDPKIDTTTLSTLNQRRWWTEEELNSFVPQVEIATASATPTPTPEATIEPTTSATQSAVQSSSSSAQIQ